ncbi:MAG: hypothetical protein JWN45_2973 [Acidobacteriaceae bacterium]|nr:hypothetical protein [Acidobacteriaceae bacterium]
MPLGPGNVGGRTRALLIDSNDANTMYAAGVAGGVWKSSNAGGSWSPISDLIANLAVTTLAMDPSNHNVIYAGTGEGYSNYDAVRGGGIFKSVDGGANWSHLNPPNPMFYPNAFDYVFKILVSPHNPANIYVAAKSGVWSSADSGATWRWSVVGSTCPDLVMRSDKGGDYLIAACGQFSRGSILRNPNAETNGSQWQSLLSDDAIGRISLALAPSNQDVIYAMADRLQDPNRNYALRAVYRSTSSGDPNTWTVQTSAASPIKLNTLLLTNPEAATASECGNGSSFYIDQGWYDNVLAVDPVNPNRVWAGGIDLFRSDDGGVNWGLASFWLAKEQPQYAHPDQHAILFHPSYNGSSNRTLYVGNDGGIFKTDDALASTATGPLATCDASQSAVAWTSLNNGYGVTQFYQGTPYPDGNTYFGGTQDNGTIRATVANNTSWLEILGGDGGYVAVDPTNINILYASNPGLSLKKSNDGGQTFSPATNGISDFGLFVAPFATDPAQPTRLWTGGIYLWRSNDGAANWQKASSVTPGNGLVSALAVAPGNPNLVIVGMSDGYILRNTNGLSSDASTNVGYAFPRNGFVSSIAFDPQNQNVVYATYSTFGIDHSAHVYKSTDGGITWNQSDGSGDGAIPDVPVHCIAVDPNVTSRLYAGTDVGVFVSLDGGQSWAVENTGFANVVVESLKFDSSGQHLFGFTHGRGAWRVDLRPSQLSVTPSLLNLGDQHVNSMSAPATVTVQNIGGTAVTLTGIDVSGDFSQSNNCSTLAPGVACQVSVTFSPSALGTRAGSLNINSSAIGSPSFVALRGNGFTGPAVSLSPGSIDFGTEIQFQPDQASPHEVTLTNTGNADLLIQSIKADSNWFTFFRSSKCPNILSAGASCKILVEVAVGFIGQITGKLNVYSNAVGSPQGVNLSYLGIADPNPNRPSIRGCCAPGGSIAIGAPFQLEAQVDNVTAGTLISFNGVTYPTAIVPAGATSFVRADIPAAAVAIPGVYEVKILISGNPANQLYAGRFDVYLPVPVNRMVFDPFKRRVYGASNGGTFGTPGLNLLYVIDPDTGVEKTIDLGGTISAMALSADARYLHIASGNRLLRFDTESQELDQQIILGSRSGPTPNNPTLTVYDMFVLPTDNKSVVLSFNSNGIALYRDGAQMGSEYDNFFTSFRIQLGDVQQLAFNNHSGDGLLQVGNAPYSFYALSGNPALAYLMSVGDKGVQLVSPISISDTSTSVIQNGIAYSISGSAYDLQASKTIKQYDTFTNAGVNTYGGVFPDPSRNRVIFPVQYGFNAFDLSTGDFLGYAYGPGMINTIFSAFTLVKPDTAVLADGKIHVFKTSILNPFGDVGPVPSIASVSPSGAIVGSHNQYIHLTGSNFNAGSVVRWNGEDRTTSLIDSNTLVAAISTADLASPNTAVITVFNPGSSGGSSGTAAFTVSPQPILSQPGQLDFGSLVPRIMWSTHTVRVTNNQQNRNLAIGSVQATQPDFTATHNCGSSLTPGASCDINVRFAPLDFGAKSATLVVTTDANTLSVPLSGNGFDIVLSLARPARAPRGAASQGTSSQVELTAVGAASPVDVSCTADPGYICSASPPRLQLGNQTTFVNIAVAARHNRAARLQDKTRTALTTSIPVVVEARSGNVVRQFHVSVTAQK